MKYTIPGLFGLEALVADELRRPMMLILKARKPRRSGREQE